VNESRRETGIIKPLRKTSAFRTGMQSDAYQAVAMAILDAGLISTASLPCPAEMAASIHIQGTSSSIVDTVFVCRERGTMRCAWRFENADDLAQLMTREMDELCAAGMKPTVGDTRCIAFGHITRMVIWVLRKDWDPSWPTVRKLTTIQSAMDAIATVDGVLEALYLGKAGYDQTSRQI